MCNSLLMSSLWNFLQYGKLRRRINLCNFRSPDVVPQLRVIDSLASTPGSHSYHLLYI